jgi:hypothetical protein
MASTSLRPRLLRLAGSSKTHSSASAWNILFSELGPCLVRATLTDGRTIGGLYDGASASGYSEQTRDLYLSRRLQISADGWFIAPMDGSLGVWLSEDSIISLEFNELQALDRETPKISG